MTFKSIFIAVLLFAPFMLSACGEYDVVYTRDVFPYGDDRTAGSGVVYVSKKLMPAKDLKLEPVSAKVKALPKNDPIQKAFRDYQKKSK